MNQRALTRILEHVKSHVIIMKYTFTNSQIYCHRKRIPYQRLSFKPKNAPVAITNLIHSCLEEKMFLVKLLRVLTVPSFVTCFKMHSPIDTRTSKFCEVCRTKQTFRVNSLCRARGN